jgi:hypothetical protein
LSNGNEAAMNELHVGLTQAEATAMLVIRLAACLLLCFSLQAQPTSESPPLLPGNAKTLARPDLVLHYKDCGQGELVLMGGPGFSGEGMEPEAQMIARHGRAIRTMIFS